MYDGKWFTLIFVAGFLLSIPARSITINPTFVDSVGQIWDAAKQGVVETAIQDWENVFSDSVTLDITFDFTEAGTSGYLGQWAASLSYFIGDDIYPWYSGLTHTIHFNADLFAGVNYTWWDPTPGTSDDQPSEAWDALSVARHELGHALGFSSIFATDKGASEEVALFTSHVSAGVFDPGGLNVAMDGDGIHIDQSYDDLMSPALVNNVRREISQRDIDMLVLAIGYQVVPIPEPATLALCILMAGFLASGRRFSALCRNRV